jgi:hypothetical protein
LAVAAAFIVLAGGAAGAMHLLGGISTGTPWITLAWDQGVEIDQRQVQGDSAVALARGVRLIRRAAGGVRHVRRRGQRPRAPGTCRPPVDQLAY